MPRPGLKRKRSATPQPSNTRKVNPRIHPPSWARNHLEEKLQNTPVGARQTDSDDSDKLVTRSRSCYGREPFREIYASGGVAKEDVPAAHPSRQNLKENRARSRALRAAQSSRGVQAAISATAAALSSTFNAAPQSQSLQPVALVAPPQQLSSPSAQSSTRPKVAPTPLRHTPNGATSFLGTLQPRRRQNSILYRAGGYDSSSLSLGDEADFLPDAESTPPNVSNNAARPSTPLSSLLDSSSSRKRKITPIATQQPVDQRSIKALESDAMQKSIKRVDEPQFPQQDRDELQPEQRQRSPRIDNSIMAPPESSSSPAPDLVRNEEPSPIKIKRTRKEPTNRPLSTHQLQSMMPRRVKIRKPRREAPGEFDIPADPSQSDPDTPPALDDSEGFVPYAKQRKGRNAAKVRRATKKADSAKHRGRNHSDRSTLSPVKGNRVTKSASQLSLSTTAKSRTYGSQRLPKPRSGSANDKENQPDDLSVNFNEPALGEDGTLPSDGRDPHKALQMVKNQFAAIDEWDMEFEEVDISSSDPNMR